MSVDLLRLARAAGGGGGGPDDVAGLVAWWDAADASTVTESGGFVTAWENKAGTATIGNLATSSALTYGTNQLNGLDVVSFPELNVVSAGLVTLPQPFTFFIVARQVVTTSRSLLFQTTSNVQCRFGDSQTQMFAGSFINGDAVDTNWHTVVSVFNGASSVLRQNGVSITGNVGTTAIANHELTIGSAVFGAVTSLNGDVAEVLFYNTAISGSDLATIESYLSDKWQV